MSLYAVVSYRPQGVWVNAEGDRRSPVPRRSPSAEFDGPQPGRPARPGRLHVRAAFVTGRSVSVSRSSLSNFLAVILGTKEGIIVLTLLTPAVERPPSAAPPGRPGDCQAALCAHRGGPRRDSHRYGDPGLPAWGCDLVGPSTTTPVDVAKDVRDDPAGLRVLVGWDVLDPDLEPAEPSLDLDLVGVLPDGRVGDDPDLRPVEADPGDAHGDDGVDIGREELPCRPRRPAYTTRGSPERMTSAASSSSSRVWGGFRTEWTTRSRSPTAAAEIASSAPDGIRRRLAPADTARWTSANSSASAVVDSRARGRIEVGVRLSPAPADTDPRPAPPSSLSPRIVIRRRRGRSEVFTAPFAARGILALG